MPKYYLYKKDKKEFLPVEDEKVNLLAKKRLEEILKGDTKLQIPEIYKELGDGLALFNSNGNLDKANSLYLVQERTTYDLTNKLNELTAKEWLTETVTVFAQKGLGAGNKDAQIEKQHPAPFSFQDVARLIRFFSKGGEKILDPFSGVASTLKACAIEGRIGYGIELNQKYVELSHQRLSQEVPDTAPFKDQQHLINGDSLIEIKQFERNFFDFIVTSPPYWNILDTVDHKVRQTRVDNNLDIKYSEEVADLANIPDYDQFIETLSDLFDGCAQILKKGKYMCVIVSDFRKKERYYVFHADLAKAIEAKGNFKLKGIRILHQRHKSIFPYGYPFSFVPNMHHQNVLIFQRSNEI